jgi:hypothetical protein
MWKVENGHGWQHMEERRPPTAGPGRASHGPMGVAAGWSGSGVVAMSSVEGDDPGHDRLDRPGGDRAFVGGGCCGGGGGCGDGDGQSPVVTAGHRVSVAEEVGNCDGPYSRTVTRELMGASLHGGGHEAQQRTWTW